MKTHVISVGFEIPENSSVEMISFSSDRSLLDADTIIFAPDISDYYWSEPYRGKSTISETDSPRLEQQAAHWRRQLKIALDAGKTVFLFMLEATDVFVYSGEKQYDGKGRNARVTDIVKPFDPYSSIPVPELPQVLRRSAGDRLKPTTHMNLLASYWQAFGAYTSYDIYFEEPIGRPALVTQVGDKMVAGILLLGDHKGAVVMLPPPDFERMVAARRRQLLQHAKGNKESVSPGRGSTRRRAKSFAVKAEKSVGLQFVSAIIEIDKALRAQTERTPTPDWAQRQEFVLKQERALQKRITDVDAQIAGLSGQKRDAESDLVRAGMLRGLLFETGKTLESAVLEALRLMRFRADRFTAGDSDFDVLFEDPDGTRFIGEVEGKNDKAINIDKLTQLERNLQEDFARRDDNVYARGVLFANAFRLMPLDERPEYFTAKCVAGAERSGVALVRTPDLFAIAKYLAENGDSEFGDLCRQAICSSRGTLVKFPPIPEHTRLESSAARA